MTEKEARQLLPQTVVEWDNDPKDLGTVLEIGKNGFSVNWADGEQNWIAFSNAEKVSIY